MSRLPVVLSLGALLCLGLLVSLWLGEPPAIPSDADASRPVGESGPDAPGRGPHRPDRRAVPPAVVRVCRQVSPEDLVDAPEALVTVADGGIRLPHEGQGRFRLPGADLQVVTAEIPGFGRTGTLVDPGRPETLTVVIRPGLQVRLTFVNRAGARIPGVTAVLSRKREGATAEPGDGGEGADLWSAQSDRQGVLTFIGVPGFGEYRYAIASGHRVLCQPAGAEDDTSATFRLLAADREFTCTVVGGSIHGVLSSHLRGAAESLVLYGLTGPRRGSTLLAGRTTRSLRRITPEAGTDRFCFGGLPDGEYIVTAQASDPDRVAFATRYARIEDGRDQDLGEVGPLQGAGLRVRCALQDPQGRGIAGPLSGTEQPTVRVNVLAGADVRVESDFSRWIQTSFALPVERDVVLYGLPAGIARLDLRELRWEVPRGWSWIEGRDSSLRVAMPAESARIPIVFEAMAERRFSLLRADGGREERLAMIVATPTRTFAEEFEVVFPAGQTRLEFTRNVPVAELAAYAVDAARTRCGFVAGATGPVAIQLEPAATATVRLEGGDAPDGGVLGFGLRGLGRGIGTAEVSKAGTITLTGLPAGAEVRLYSVPPAARVVVLRGGNPVAKEPW